VAETAELESRIDPTLDHIKREVISTAESPHAQHQQPRRAPAPVLDEEDRGRQNADEKITRLLKKSTRPIRATKVNAGIYL
jgi:hypothetical protein